MTFFKSRSLGLSFMSPQCDPRPTLPIDMPTLKPSYRDSVTFQAQVLDDVLGSIDGKKRYDAIGRPDRWSSAKLTLDAAMMKKCLPTD